MPTKDFFSAQAESYARFRPHYPPELFAWLAESAGGRQMAWEVGCGSGQATRDLARHFAWVVACDPSRRQLARAPALPNVEYRCVAAAPTDLADQSVDLVLVAQALHWFALEDFYAEVRRVVRPGGMIAALCYGLLRITPAVDAVIEYLYHEIVGDFWPAERRHIESGYRTLSFPFPTLVVPEFPMQTQWTCDHLLGYLASWSAVARYRRQHRADPLAKIEASLRAAWGTAPARPVAWPLTILAGRTGDFRETR